MYSYIDWFNEKIRKELRKAIAPEDADRARQNQLIKGIWPGLLAIKKDSGGYSLNLFKSSFIDKLRRSPHKVIIEVLRQIKEHQDTTGIIVFTPRHKIWKFAENIASVNAVMNDIEYSNGISIISNTEADRIQIFFPNKPNEDLRKELKSHGWRWSPKQGAWQRKKTINAYRSAKNICENTNENLAS
jgi:hypothetical protein